MEPANYRNHLKMPQQLLTLLYLLLAVENMQTIKIDISFGMQLEVVLAI